jgi:hypothetical protein
MAASFNDSAVLGVNPAFIARVEAALLSAVININSEGIAVVNHSPRIQFVHQVLQSPTNLTNYATMFALSVATDANVIADATQAGTVVLTTNNIAAQEALVTDTHITNAVSGQFNAYCSGIIA